MDLPLPPIAFNGTLLPLAVVAIAMIGVTIFLLGKVLPVDGRPPLVSQVVLALAVLGGGSLLLLSLLLVFVNPNGYDAWTWVLMSFNFMMMAPIGIWFIGVIAFRDRRIRTQVWTWPGSIAIVTTGSEGLMGFLFAQGTASSPLTLLAVGAQGLASVWFFWSMAGVMTALILWAPVSKVERRALLALMVSAVVGPWVTAYPTIGGAAMGGVMALFFALLLRPLVRGEVAREEVGLLFGLAGAFLATALAGFTVAAGNGSPVTDLVFGITMAVVMAVEIAYLFRRFYHGAPFAPWVPRTRSKGRKEWSAGTTALPMDR